MAGRYWGKVHGQHAAEVQQADLAWERHGCSGKAVCGRDGGTGRSLWQQGSGSGGSSREARGRVLQPPPRPWPCQTVLLPDSSLPPPSSLEHMYPTLVIRNIQQDRQGFPPKCLTYRITKSLPPQKSLTERETRFIPTSYKSVFSTHANNMQKCPMNLLPGNQITPQIYLLHNDIHWHLLTYFCAGI